MDCVDSDFDFDSDSDLWRYEEGSYEGEVNEAKNPEGQVGELLMSLKVSKLLPLLYLRLNVYALSLVSAYFLPENFHFCVLSSFLPHQGTFEYRGDDEAARLMYDGGWKDKAAEGYGVMKWQNGDR